MNNSDRLGLFVIMAVVAVIFFVLFLIFNDGGGKNTAPEVLPFDSSEIPIDDFEHTPQYQRTTFDPATSSGQSYMSASSGSGSYSGGESDPDSGTTPVASMSGLSGFDPRLAEYIRPAPAIDYDKRKARLREKLRREGHTNEEYIQMLVFEVDDRQIVKAINEAEVSANAGDFGSAIRSLKKQLNEVHPGDLLGKQRLLNTLQILYMEGGYPDDARNNTRALVALQKQILNMHLNSATAKDPRMKSIFENQLAQLDQTNENGENVIVAATSYMMEHLKQNRGFSPEMRRTVQGGFVNAVNQSGGQADMGTVRNDFDKIDERLRRNWADTR
jgi:hypothetical protein